MEYLNESTKEHDLINYNNVINWLDESLNLDPSLDNPAWQAKYNSISSKHSSNANKDDEKKELEEIISKLKLINPEHFRTLELNQEFLEKKKDITELLSFEKQLRIIYSKSSKKKRLKVLDIISKTYIFLNELPPDDNFDYKKLVEDFFEFIGADEENTNVASYLVLKSLYSIGRLKEISKGIALAKKSLDAKWSSRYINIISSILLIEDSNIPILSEAINSPSSNINSSQVKRINVDILVAQNKFDDAINLINISYDSKIFSFSDYVIAKTYTLLKSGRYAEVISFVGDNIDKVKDANKRDVIIINREVAKKNSGQEIRRIDLHSVISHFQSKGNESMCAFYLLDDLVQARRILRGYINNDFFNYYIFSNWPAIPESELKDFTPERIAS
ncbi:hypothetical protein [Rosenbergiella epipactidis]|uniref:hypothetical protein n=1 Tax=Rosenbergiella epipactidis TaxID=1544694 RepID=UPI001F4E9C34|nr:hypothetical protein [Rosenbergiella epipactidis]